MCKLGAVLALALLAAATVVMPSSAALLADEAQVQLTIGERLLGAGDLGRAEIELQKVVADYPSTEAVPWARVRLAECHFRQNRFDDCILEARRVVNLSQSSSEQLVAAWAQVFVGLGYKGKGQLDSEIWELAKVRAILGDNPSRKPLLRAEIELALAHHNRNDRKDAIALAREVLADPAALNADRAWAEVVLGSALLGEWRIAEGLAELQKVKDRFGGLQDQVQQAERSIFDKKYLGPHDYDGAIREAGSILSSANVSEGRARQARRVTALAYLYKGDYDHAIAEATAFLVKYRGADEDCRACYAIQAQSYAMKKQYDQAISCLQSELATDPPDHEIRARIEWDLATCYRALGDPASASEHYRRIVDQYATSHLSIRAAAELAK